MTRTDKTLAIFAVFSLIIFGSIAGCAPKAARVDQVSCPLDTTLRSPVPGDWNCVGGSWKFTSREEK